MCHGSNLYALKTMKIWMQLCTKNHENIPALLSGFKAQKKKWRKKLQGPFQFFQNLIKY